MNTNIKIMRFSAIMAILSLIISYSIYLNMELGFCVLNSPWISNSFLLSIFSSVFVGFVVALLMEVRQYTINKVIAKNQIFRNSTILFGQFSILKYTLLRLKEQSNDIISQEAFSMPVSLCEQIIDSLHNIDYHPIRKCDKLAENLKEMDYFITNSITPFLFNIKLIQQAIIKDKILDLQQTGKSTNPTYNSFYCKQTIDKLLKDIIPIVNDLTICAQKISKATDYQERFYQINNNFTHYEENYEAPSLEKYLGL